MVECWLLCIQLIKFILKTWACDSKVELVSNFLSSVQCFTRYMYSHLAQFCPALIFECSVPWFVCWHIWHGFYFSCLKAWDTSAVIYEVLKWPFEEKLACICESEADPCGNSLVCINWQQPRHRVYIMFCFRGEEIPSTEDDVPISNYTVTNNIQHAILFLWYKYWHKDALFWEHV